ncbi:MAG: UDP-N-acetylmuramoyl-L-alanyl-D-glutamate--2,6-diaminopimelate ligase [candidate division WOR-3 bacterium]
MLLSELAEGFKVKNTKDVEIRGIAYNSKKVKESFLFVALKGRNTDGHYFIQEAIQNGASALMVEKEVDSPVPIIVSNNTRKDLGVISARFFGFPSKLLKTIGVTGTKGKTTTTFMIRDMLKAQGETVGLLGTIYYCADDNCIPAGRTTPESSDIQEFMRNSYNLGAKYFVMEVSSAGIEEYRLEGTHFYIGCFTNFSREHLEYHGTLENYLNAKLKFFKEYKPEFSIINLDDPVADKFLQVAQNAFTYSINSSAADLKAEVVNLDLSGTTINLSGVLEERGVFIPLPGIFNIYNFLCAALSLYILGKHHNLKDLAKEIKPVPGRFQLVPNNCGITVIIDYAHTPEAMENLLKNVRALKLSRIITVFGAGGDRDPGKRPLFGSIAEKYSDIQIVTSDNPRSESPIKIIQDILKGMKGERAKVLPDRKEAIFYAIKKANPGDVVLIIGKGHEDYQEINGIRYPFSDFEVAEEALREIQCLQ